MNIAGKLWLIHMLKRRMYEWDTDRLERHQQERLRSILDFAADRSPYYSRLFNGKRPFSFSLLPEMDKARMMENFDLINTAGLKRDQLIEFKIGQEQKGQTGLYRREFSVGLSSGTSGNKGLTVLSKHERQLYGCLVWARNGIPDSIRPRRILFALRTNNPAFVQLGAFGYSLVYIDYTHPPEQIIELINQKRLNILTGPPSLLSIIAQLRERIASPIHAVISYAEVLDTPTKAYLSRAFNAPVIEIYQGAEGFIGWTCKKGRLHINEDAILVEEKNAGDRAGSASKLLITDLYRTTQPMIRYSMNDIVEISSQPCECGSCFRVIERIHGREDDVFHLKGFNGEVRYLFPDYVRRSINQASDEILEYQAIQHTADWIEIRLLLQEGVNRSLIEKKVLGGLMGWAAKVGGQLGKVTFTDALPEKNPQSHKLIRVNRRF